MTEGARKTASNCSYPPADVQLRRYKWTALIPFCRVQLATAKVYPEIVADDLWGANVETEAAAGLKQPSAGRTETVASKACTIYSHGVSGKRKRRGIKDVIQSRGRVQWIQDRRIACLLDFLTCYQRRPARPITNSRLCARNVIRADRK
ncbi:hypothetical protein ALC62_04132 [Cyphomyrmex costatus]|uniref:Uncharacterized protein n=1 Tax=Cyphomyrmex costatus TaxID=456900 RepID=A0A151IKJ3_9HYME|nr:hypothetical protein ALC62_04132 [Cyphomyrmex costatus]